MEIVAFTKFNFDGIHMPIVFRSSDTIYCILSVFSIAALFLSYLISLQMVMSSHYKDANSKLRKSGSTQSASNDSEST